MGYTFEVVYKPGLENKAANALSRMPPIEHLYHLIAPTLFDLIVIKDEVDKDPRLHEIIAELQKMSYKKMMELLTLPYNSDIKGGW